MAPTGSYGSIVEVIMRKTGDQRVSDNDTRNLVEFWKQIYDIDISSDEIPLLRVNSEATFTYPPSMCFFAGGDSLVIPADVQKFIESKNSILKTRMDEVASKAIHDLRIGDLSLGSDTAITEQRADLQTQLLQETRQRLFGRNVSAWGSVLGRLSIFIEHTRSVLCISILLLVSKYIFILRSETVHLPLRIIPPTSDNYVIHNSYQ